MRSPASTSAKAKVIQEHLKPQAGCPAHLIGGSLSTRVANATIHDFFCSVTKVTVAFSYKPESVSLGHRINYFLFHFEVRAVFCFHAGVTRAHQ